MKYRILIFGLVVLLVLVTAVALLFGRKGTGGGLSGKITVWSFEEESVWSEVIDAFESQNPKASVTYVKKSPETYESELLNALAAGKGPDVFAFHRAWAGKHKDKIAPFPQEIARPTDFSLTFVDVAAKDLIRDDSVLALPLYIDTLALYYNKDLLDDAGIALPPKIWEEFNRATEKITAQDSTGTLLRSGAALGTANNISYAPDILQFLMLQNGTRMIDETGRSAFTKQVVLENKSFVPGQDAFEFYTSFSNPESPVFSWNRREPLDKSAFKNGRVGFFIGYGRDWQEFKNSNRFGIAAIPQIKDRAKDPSYLDVSYADYWAYATNLLSPNRQTSWQFINFATSRNAAFSFLNKTGLATARRDLVEAQSQNPALAILTRQSLIADSWPQPDPEQVREIFKNAIEEFVLGRVNSRDALEQAAAQIDGLLNSAF